MHEQSRTVSIIEHATKAPVEAVLRRRLSIEDLTTAEDSWQLVRDQLVARQRQAGRRTVTQHGHWNWASEYKSEAIDARRMVVVGVERDGQWQGLMAVIASPRPSRSWMPLIGRLLRGSVLYVDYLESAPWNNPDLTVPDLPRFGGVGTQLLMEAIRLSIELGLNGQVGLHSLPQAVEFYIRRGMRLRIRSDRAYHGLPYFEYTAGGARAQLARFE
jgi:GNAT superfamily N-acetyltransferase